LKPGNTTIKQIEAILDRHKAGASSPEDLILLESWYVAQQADVLPLIDQDVDSRLAQVKKNLLFKIADKHITLPKKSIPLWTRIAVAASIVLAAASVYFTVFSNDESEELRIAALDAGIKPGGDKAVLTLANGKKVILNDVKLGEISSQAGIRIKKESNGILVYEVAAQNTGEANAESQWNTLETPKGGQYQVVLSDGSKVWLNAYSSIKFPAVFSTKSREVEMTGEAYFQVAKRTIGGTKVAQSFIVRAHRQRIEVLGTHFNVNSYADEHSVKTTLLEGSVAINTLRDNLKAAGSNVVLKPGQQSELNSSGDLAVSSVNVGEAIDWQKGYFAFHNEDVYQIMRKVARWYDIQVVYESSLPKDKLGGTLSRYQDVSKILDVMQRTGLFKFRIKGKTAYVRKA
jgi:transmembrane sensor